MILFIDKETGYFSAHAIALVNNALSIGIFLCCMFEKNKCNSFRIHSQDFTTLQLKESA